MLQKLGKNIVMASMFFLFFFEKTYPVFNTTYISKETFESILNELPNSKIIPITGEKWTPSNYTNDREVREKKTPFGAIAQEVFDFIRSILSEGKVLLELGSGWSSSQFSKYYTVYSVEHNPRWLGKYNINYIYAPIKDKWYNPNILKEKLPQNYDLILVDGPPGYPGCRTDRYGFYTHLELFKTNLPIVFDDVNRKTEYELMLQVGKKLQRDVVVFNCKSKGGKKFGVILYEETT